MQSIGKGTKMGASRMGRNRNRIQTSGFSNQDTRDLYEKQAPIPDRQQCGGCSYYALFNEDFGLCCHPEARFYLETVFEHFGCEKNVFEGWDAHSFRKDTRSLPDRKDLLALLRRCDTAIGGRRGIEPLSTDIRRLHLEIKAVLRRWESERGKETAIWDTEDA